MKMDMNMPEHVTMERAVPVFPGGPATARVHPDEVETWRASGWRVATQNAGATAQNAGATARNAGGKPGAQPALSKACLRNGKRGGE